MSQNIEAYNMIKDIANLPNGMGFFVLLVPVVLIAIILMCIVYFYQNKKVNNGQTSMS